MTLSLNNEFERYGSGRGLLWGKIPGLSGSTEKNHENLSQKSVSAKIWTEKLPQVGQKRYRLNQLVR
jgi:hypothetical protein